MAGTIRGSIEHRFNSGSQQANQRDAFVAIVKFFDAHPGYTRIASNYGTGGTGFAYTGGAVPGENAFAVWRNNAGASRYYVLAQWSFNSAFGAAPGNPGNVVGNYGIGVQVALDSSGSSPWNGGTANAGADAKGATVWIANGGTLAVFPRANGSGGTYAANKEACACVSLDSPSDHRLQIVGDDDAFVVATDHGNAGKYDLFLYFGPYAPAGGVTAPKPLCMLGMQPPLLVTTGLGPLANNNNNNGGALRALASGVRVVSTDRLAEVLKPAQQPNAQRGGDFDELPVQLRLNDSEGAGTYGYLGTIDFIREVAQLATHDTNGALTRAVLGSATVGDVKFSIPWDGATVPGSGATGAGVLF